MKKKLFVVFVTLLMITSTYILVSIDEFEVKATPGGGGGSEEDDIGLDFDWMWDEAITTICEAVYDAYIGEEIIRGREFGTIGENYTADKIAGFMDVNCGLENATMLQLKPIKECKHRFYTTRMNVTDYLLHIKIDSENYDKDIPVNESYVIPMARPKDPGTLDLDFNWTLPVEDNIVVFLHPEGNWPAGGALTNYSSHYNLSINSANGFDFLVGNATYIENGDPLPPDQEDRVFIFDENETGENQLKNVTNATGVLLIYYEGRYEINKDVLAEKNFSICRVNASEGNLANVLNVLESEPIIADNILDNNTLTCTYDLENAWVPDSDYVVLNLNRSWQETEIEFKLLKIRFNATWDYILYVFNQGAPLLGKGLCKGLIAYQNKFDSDQERRSHVMNQAVPGGLYNTWFRYSKIYAKDMRKVEYNRLRVVAYPALPIFYVNYSIGNCLYENHSEAFISGYEDQEYIQEEHPLSPWAQWKAGVEAYNVIGNLTKDKSDNPPDPDDPTVLISNRYDGWWSEAAFDSGVGTGVVLAIAKYFNYYNITPKVNITFLETTGEEYMFRGAQHFSDSHPDMNYSLWIGFDQLASDWNNTYIELTYGYDDIRNICENISIENGYPNRTDKNYTLKHNVTWGFTGAEEDVWKQRNLSKVQGGINCKYGCKTICFSRENDNRFRHRRGDMIDGRFTAGDIMDNIDREDLNNTLVLAWDIVKYFTVNPDCWFESNESALIDTDDENEYNDSIRTNFTVKTILPHDRMMVEAVIHNDTKVFANKTMKFNVSSSGHNGSIVVTLPEGEFPAYYNHTIRLYNSTGKIDEIMTSEGINYNESHTTYDWDLYPYDWGGNTPDITNVSATPVTLGFGFNVTISADVISTVGSDIDMVEVIITNPVISMKNFTMNNIGGDTYEYVFNETWKWGTYRYVILVEDEWGNKSETPQHYFYVNCNATVSICTIKDSYGDGEIVNLTDPPGNIGDSGQNIGYELLDEGDILHIWNRFDSYYFNTSNGIQFTNHKDDYWSHNVLMLGYYNNDVWNLIYRTDELSGFNKNIKSDNKTFVNATLWKDLSYGGYDFRLAIKYHLGVDDNELMVIPYIKNLDEDIPLVLGFGWEMKDIQVDMTPVGDYIEIDETSYYLNQSLDETYTDLDLPCFYIKEDLSDTWSKSLYLRWENDLNYKVKVKSRSGQYNAPVTLFIRIGTLDSGQEKHTELYWYDADQVTYYFNDYDTGEAWSSNPNYMVDSNESNYASTTSFWDVELCDNNTCNGSYLGGISKVEIRAKAYYTGKSVDLKLRPVFGGTKDGDEYIYDAPSGSGQWSDWFDITNDSSGFSSDWSWSDVKDLDCDVQPSSGFGMFTLYCSKVVLRVTYTTNFAPVISNPYPMDGSTEISITPLLNITVSDSDGDDMNITWLSNSSGTWEVFGTNSSVGNGTYHQVYSNATENGKWWHWRVNVSDGKCYTVSNNFSFYTGSESRIYNTGSSNISGYLSMQVEFYNTTSEEWEFDTSVIDEKSTRRIINISEKLALDTIFNPENVNTSSFSHGNGTYRVYAAFRDPCTNVLHVCDDTVSPPVWWYLEDYYEFTVTGL